MKTLWLVPSLVSCSLLALHAQMPSAVAQTNSVPLVAQASSGRLTSWTFVGASRQLEFKTSEGVQPRARLISNPTRLVIDLPGIRLGRPPVNQPLSGLFQVLKLGQFDRWTSRIVIQLDPGYTLEPSQIQFRGLNPGSWTVQLPLPQRIQSGATRGSIRGGVRSKPTQGEVWSDDTDASSGFDRLSQIRGNRSWETSESNNNNALIEAIELNPSNSQLLIRSSQSFLYTSGWDRLTGAYRVSLSAQLMSGLRLPPTGGNSPFTRVQLRREGDSAVLLLYPSARTRIGNLTQVNNRLLALDLDATSISVTPSIEPRISTAGTPNEIPIPVPPPLSTSIPSTGTLPDRSPVSLPDLPNVPRRGYVVVIDPGHGGPDPGAVGIGGMREKDIVIDISRQVSARLQQQGVSVILTRPDDRDLDLEPRVQIAQRANATVFVSIHANAISMSRPEVNGVETFYYASAASGRLASILQRTILRATGADDRGVRTARFYVLRHTSMPSVLVEVGFVTGREDAPRLATANYRTLLADSIARGILEYLQNVR